MKKVTGLMANLGIGGAEVQSVILFNGLCKNGYKVKLIVLEDNRKNLADRLDKSIEVAYVNRRHYIDPLSVLEVKRLICEEMPDYLIMVDNYPVLYGILLKKLFKLKLNNFAILHNTIPPNLKREIQNRFVYGPSLNRLGRVVFVCSRQKDYWVDRYGINPGKSAVVLNGIDIEHFNQFSNSNDKYKCREKLGIPSDITVLAINASLWPAKSHEHMIEAMYMLKKEGLELFLLIIGDGPRRKYLERLVSDKGLTDRVLITGYVRDIRPYLMCADISVLTSTATETLSMAALESMALGKALILSNIGGAPEIVDDGVNGYLYSPGNVLELAVAIKRMAEGRIYRIMGEKALLKVSSLFTQEKMISGYIQLLESG
ncbi:MAG: hypothetical protein A2Y21_10560 [Clostridiales bacterium GWC2_40_7]|nr:MAG: hypothetical protein A2Y21_10560 [Clostridiales bacterium GWC2_40_7]